MPLVDVSGAAGIVEITHLTRGGVAKVLDEWNKVFEDGLWLHVESVGTRSGDDVCFVTNNRVVESSFDLFGWLDRVSGVRLDAVSARGALEWRDDSRVPLAVVGGLPYASAPQDRGGVQGVAQANEQLVQDMIPQIRQQMSPQSNGQMTQNGIPQANGQMTQNGIPQANEQVSQYMAPQQSPVSNTQEGRNGYSNTMLDDDDYAPTSYLAGDDGDDNENPFEHYTLFSSARSMRVDVYADKPVIVGRSRKMSNLHLDNHGISRRQAELSLSPSGILTVRDLGSTNGTYINGSRIESYKEYELHKGDSVQFYNEEFDVE